MSDVKKRVAMLLMNPCINDSRVIKEAETLAHAGYRVRVFCLQASEVPQQQIVNDVEYYRVQFCSFRAKKSKTMTSTQSTENEKKPSPSFDKIIKKNIVVPLIEITKVKHLLKYFLPYKIFKKALSDFQPDIIHAHDLITLPAATKLARNTSTKVVYDAHELEQHRMPVQPQFVRTYIDFIEKKYIPKVDKMITVSESIADTFAQSCRIPVPKVLLNSPVIHDLHFDRDVRSDTGLTKEIPLAVYVGAAQQGRGVEELFAALSYLPEFYLAMVGALTPRYETELKQFVTKYGIEKRIIFLDAVPHTFVASYISTADIGVYTLQNTCLNHNYALPNKVFEMTLAGLPIVVSDLMETRKYIKNTQMGILADEKNPKAIADAMRELYENLDKYRPSKEHLKKITSTYGWQAQQSKLLQLYSEL